MPLPCEPNPLQILPCSFFSLSHSLSVSLSLFFGPALSFLVAACKEEVKSPFYFFFVVAGTLICLPCISFGFFFFDCTCVWLENYKKSALNSGRGAWQHAVGVLFTYASVFSIVRRAFLFGEG